MRLHECDSHLEHARLHLAQGEKVKVREHFDKAKGMADEMKSGHTIPVATRHPFALGLSPFASGCADAGHD